MFFELKKVNKKFHSIYIYIKVEKQTTKQQNNNTRIFLHKSCIHSSHILSCKKFFSRSLLLQFACTCLKHSYNHAHVSTRRDDVVFINLKREENECYSKQKLHAFN